MAGLCRVCRERLGEYLEYGYGRTTGDAILLCRKCATKRGKMYGVIIKIQSTTGMCNVCRKRPGKYVEYGAGWAPDNAILLCRQCAATWGLDLVKREHKTHLFLLKIVAQTLGWMISAMHRLGAARPTTGPGVANMADYQT
jgi:hypothetical protein